MEERKGGGGGDGTEEEVGQCEEQREEKSFQTHAGRKLFFQLAASREY